MFQLIPSELVKDLRVRRKLFSLIFDFNLSVKVHLKLFINYVQINGIIKTMRIILT